MTPEPSRSPGHAPRFERRVLYGGLLVALPAMLALLAVLLFGPLPGPWAWVLVAVAALLSVALARWHSRRVLFPLHTLGGLLQALREGDYSLRGRAGHVLGDVVCDVNELAERLQAERLEFEESTHLLGKTLAALDAAVLVFDKDGRLRLLNPAAQQLLDGERQELFGLSAAELGLAALLEGPATQVRTQVFPARSGRFDIRHAALRRDGRGGRLLVINDVGRALREEERLAWQRLLRVLGHEVNNSLAPIQSMAGTLATLVARQPLPHDWREDFASGLGVIEKRAAALSRFLAGYSKLARLPPPQKRDVDVAAMARKVAALEQRLAVRVASDAALSVAADPDQLEQALINLVANAVEAVPAAGGVVELRWRSDARDAVIEVLDNGPGPPRSDNQFVPFFTTKPGGSGIGLALVRQIAEAHDGSVSLEARADDDGALATLRLPLAASDVPQP